MSQTKDWTRWIITSLVKHFDFYKEDIPFFIEGQLRPTTINDFAELRIDGPYYTQLDSSMFSIKVSPAILIQIVQDGKDLYKPYKFSGVFESAFHDHIKVYRYGDDNSYLGCLQIPRLTEPIKSRSIGQIQSAVKIFQRVVETTYTMTLY